MAYIRDNEDYYISEGYSPSQAKMQVRLDKENIDYGFCNPKKIKQADQIEKEIENNG